MFVLKMHWMQTQYNKECIAEVHDRDSRNACKRISSAETQRSISGGALKIPIKRGVYPALEEKFNYS